MKVWLAVMAGIGTAFLAGVGTGRLTQPVRIATQVRTVEVAGKTIVQTVEKQNATETKGATRTIIRWIPQPQKCDGGPPAPPIVERVEESVTDTKAATFERNRGAEQDVHVVARDERKLTLREPPHWTVAGMVGVRVMTFKTPSYGAMVARDIGPLTLGAWGLRAPESLTVGLSAGIKF